MKSTIFPELRLRPSQESAYLDVCMGNKWPKDLPAFIRFPYMLGLFRLLFFVRILRSFYCCTVYLRRESGFVVDEVNMHVSQVQCEATLKPILRLSCMQGKRIGLKSLVWLELSWATSHDLTRSRPDRCNTIFQNNVSIINP